MLHQILFDVEAYCRENGINNIILQPVNDKVKEYYKKHGFVEDIYNPGGYLVKLVLTPIVIHPFTSEGTKRRTRRKHPLMKSTNRRRTLSVANRAETYPLLVENIEYESDSDDDAT